MGTGTFNPNLASQNEANWLAARRVIDNFAPHEQATPGMGLVLDPGSLLRETTLIERAAQVLVWDPPAPEAIGGGDAPGTVRVDRVVVDRETGNASILYGEKGSIAPPDLTADVYPIARVVVTKETLAITNAMIVDERCFVDGGGVSEGGGGDPTPAPEAFTRVAFKAYLSFAGFTLPKASIGWKAIKFDVDNLSAYEPPPPPPDTVPESDPDMLDDGQFVAPASGTYLIIGQVTAEMPNANYLRAEVRVHHAASPIRVVATSFGDFFETSGATNARSARMMTLTTLSTGDRVELRAWSSSGQDRFVVAGEEATYLAVTRVAEFAG